VVGSEQKLVLQPTGVPQGAIPDGQPPKVHHPKVQKKPVSNNVSPPPTEENGALPSVPATSIEPVGRKDLLPGTEVTSAQPLPDLAEDSPSPAEVVEEPKPVGRKDKRARAEVDEDGSSQPRNVAPKKTTKPKNELPVRVEVQEEPSKGLGIANQYVKLVVDYPKSDIRNPEAVEALFRRSLSDLQNAPLQRTYPADCPAYSDIRIRPMGIKVEVQKMMDTFDGERKWNTMGYGFVKHGAEVSTYGMMAPKLSQRDYFVAKNYQDHPATTLPDGTQTMEIRLPSEMFHYELSGPVMPPVSVSSKKRPAASNAQAKKD